jgi:hypothetical protein
MVSSKMDVSATTVRSLEDTVLAVTVLPVRDTSVPAVRSVATKAPVAVALRDPVVVRSFSVIILVLFNRAVAALALVRSSVEPPVSVSALVTVAFTSVAA